jgi:hypothetical protein
MTTISDIFDTTPSTPDSRQFAYQAAGKISKSRMAREAPLDAAALEAVEASDIVVVTGCYDHVEQVLGALEVPYTTVDSRHLDNLPLRPEQLLVVNCPGEMSPVAIVRIRDFVANGGTLFTTDWALRHVVEPAFPGHVAYNGRSTGDDVVRIEVVDATSPYLAGVLDAENDPQWWLEGSSYPITVVDPERVRVLIRSRELGEKYGEQAVAVVFPYGKGEVFHMISHYYLQRTELRNDRHQQTAASYATEKGVPVDSEMAAIMSNLNLGDVESAESSTRLFANIVADKKLRIMEQQQDG